MKELKIEIWDIGRLVPYSLNVKKHDPEQVDKIAKSITEFGWDQPIVVDQNGVIIKGHGRRLAALKLGIKGVPVLIRDDLTEDQIRASRLTDNRVAEGDIDTEMFRRELESLDYDLVGIFDDKELDFGTLDLGEISDLSFIDDVEGEVRGQKAATQTHIEETAVRSVQIGKALGFKAISGADEIHVAQFIAEIMNDFDPDPAVAFVKFAKQYLGAKK